MFRELFSPIKIRDVEFRNRVVFPAMGTKMAGDGKYVTDQIIDYHLARARGGNGINFTEVCGVHDESTPDGYLSLGDDKYIPMLKKLTRAIHKEGGKAGVQLWQGGLAVLNYQEENIFLASDLELADRKYEGMTKDEIDMIVDSYGKAAKRAVEAGFDCLEFHAGHNYLPHEFLSAGLNRRDDEYGGSFENRMRFPLECIEEIRKNIPEGMPLFMRVVAHDDELENGLTIDDTVEFCKRAGELGVDVLNVSRGNFMGSAIKYEVPPVDLKKGFNVSNAEYIRDKTKMTTIAVGRINDPEQANEIIKNDRADMVVIGRGQLADPDFCSKAKEGRVKEIVKCIGCNQGCYDGFVSEEVPFITCLRNPALGREREYDLVQTDNPKDVMVIGAGVGGLEAAITLKRRGHNPVVYELSDRVGGQFVLAGEAPRKEELKEAALAMGELAKIEGIEIKFNTEVTGELIGEVDPDEVIIATGATSLIPGIKGIDLPNVTDSHTVLSGDFDTEGDIVIVGGGLVGLEVSEMLSEKHDNIRVIEMMDEVAKDLGQIRKICVMESLHNEGIKTITEAKCSEILEDGVVVEIDGEDKKIPGDTVVIAIGARARDTEELVEACEGKNIPYYIIGDAKRPRRALNATAEAGEVARSI